MENDKQYEDRKNTEHFDESDSGEKKFSSERKAQKLSEAEENLEHGKDKAVHMLVSTAVTHVRGLQQHWSKLYVYFSKTFSFVRATL